MGWRINPFSDLYLSENIKGDDFVRLFSDKIVKEATNLFTQENTVIEGVQGSGKSMLLNLLRPEIRAAYFNKNVDFPVDGNFSKFLSGGVNLTQSGAKDFYNLQSKRAPRDWEEEIPLLFGDFVNYQIVASFLASISLYQAAGEKICHSVGLNSSNEALSEFSKSIASSDLWFGAHRDVSTYQDLCSSVNDRIGFYKSLLNLNVRNIPDHIRESKTAIAEPIFLLGNCAKEVGLLSHDSSVLVYIDQYEELDHLSSDKTSVLYQLRKVVNKALHARNNSASFKVGTRGYAWRRNMDVYGSEAKLENNRDYSLISISEIMRHTEAAKSGIYRDFCEDVFERRIDESGLEYQEGVSDLLTYVFGRSKAKEAKANCYGGVKPEGKLRFDKSWSPEWKEFLICKSEENLLDAHLAAAYVRQKGKSSYMHQFQDAKFPPWGKWWKKERIDAATIQISGNAKESLRYSGKEDIIAISGGNILAFINICSSIWSTYVSATPDSKVSVDFLPEDMPESYQASGILNSSKSWLEKLSELPGGERRKRFVRELAGMLNKKLSEDLSLSNPGHYGFSVSQSELDRYPAVKLFLDECVDYSALVHKLHSTKLPDKVYRHKYYFVNILCPVFRLPHSHTKEPSYLRVEEIEHILMGGKLAGKNSYQMGLF